MCRLHSNSSQRCSIGLRSLGTWLRGAQGLSHGGTAKGFRQTVKLETSNLADDDSLLVFHLLLKVNQPAEKVNLGELYCICASGADGNLHPPAQDTGVSFVFFISN